MFGRRKDRVKAGPVKRERVFLEALEQRTLLSASATDITLHSDAVVMGYAASASTLQGYTPSQIRQAYGLSTLSPSANGQGQTIAIVDAYNDPNIAADLAVFDQQFGISAPASLKVVNETGGSKLPTTDSGWSGEIALDVEWAHAMAPGANILLVEATSATVADLMAAVDYARHAAGVSTVSMSWGGSEFFSWNGGEFSSQTDYDPYFTTPAGHQGVTFISAAGDSGAQSGVQWPASSPNVLSIGGTSLSVQNQSGTYSFETSWSGTNGGYSQVEAQPTYQNSVQSSGARSVPDVAYDADPNTGFAVYSSVVDQGLSGWQEIGGTSAGAPQWAALIAITDQLRVAAGNGTLDGATQTLPALYSVYSQPGTTGYSAYASIFNDVQSNPNTGGWHWRWGWGYLGGQATTGYDTATGLGTPNAAKLLNALAGTTASGGTGGAGSTVVQLPASPITGIVTTSAPASVLGGSSGSLKVRLTNTDSTAFSGPLTITLFASTDDTVSSDDTAITTVTLAKVNLRAGASRTVRLHFTYPADITQGNYHLIASIDATGTNTAPAKAEAASALKISSPFVDLAATFAGAQSLVVNPGRRGNETITLDNVGNVTASGTVTLTLYASQNQTLDSSDTVLTTTAVRKINIRPGHSATMHVHFQAPAGAAGGTYFLIASVSSSTQPADTNAANNVAVVATA